MTRESMYVYRETEGRSWRQLLQWESYKFYRSETPGKFRNVMLEKVGEEQYDLKTIQAVYVETKYLGAFA